MLTEWKTFVMPERVDGSIYESLIDEFVENVGSSPSVKSILRYGGVSAPGISDIDLIVVLDHTHPPRPADLTYRSRIKEHRYCFAHRAGILPDNMVPRLHNLGFYDNLDVIHGDAISIEACSPELSFVLMADGLVDRLLSLAFYLGSPVCNVRTVLVLAYSLKHTLTLCREIGISLTSEIVEKTAEFVQFRANWFDHPNQTRLRPAVEQLFELFSHLTKSLGEFAVAQGWWNGRLGELDYVLQNSPTTQIIADRFTEGRNGLRYQVVTRGVTVIGRRLEVARTSVVIDPLLGPHLLAYLRQPSRHRKDLGWRVNVGFDENLIADSYAAVVQERLDTIFDHSSFLRNNGFGYGNLHTTAVIKTRLPSMDFKTSLLRLAHLGLRATLPRKHP
jgi:hypothetical protein